MYSFLALQTLAVSNEEPCTKCKRLSFSHHKQSININTFTVYIFLTSIVSPAFSFHFHFWFARVCVSKNLLALKKAKLIIQPLSNTLMQLLYRDSYEEIYEWLWLMLLFAFQWYLLAICFGNKRKMQPDPNKFCIILILRR